MKNELISRADVEQTIEDNILCYTHSDRPIDQDADTECHRAIRVALKMLRKDLRKLPSAQPERKRGEWIYNSPVTMKCEQCGYAIKDWEWNRANYCAGCGADMRGEKDDRHRTGKKDGDM